MKFYSGGILLLLGKDNDMGVFSLFVPFFFFVDLLFFSCFRRFFTFSRFSPLAGYRDEGYSQKPDQQNELHAERHLLLNCPVLRLHFGFPPVTLSMALIASWVL